MVAIPPFLEVFANDSIATVTTGGTTAPAALTQETWTVSVARAFPTAQNTLVPATAFYVVDQAAAFEPEKILVTSGAGAVGTQTWTVIRGADGTTPIAHLSNFAIVTVLGRDSFGDLEALWTPAHNGLLDANMSVDTPSQSVTISGGVLNLWKIVPRRSYLASNVWIFQSSQSVGTSTGTFVGLYSASGTLLSGSADQGANLVANTIASCPLTTPQQITAGVPYYVALLANGLSTLPNLREGCSGSTASPNANLSPANSRGANFGTGLVALPASVTMASLNQQFVALVGIS